MNKGIKNLSSRELQINLIKKMNCKELKEELKIQGIRGYSKLKKSELIEKLLITLNDDVYSLAFQEEFISCREFITDNNVEILNDEEVDLFIPEEVDIESEELSEEDFYTIEYNLMSKYDQELFYNLTRYKLNKLEERANYFEVVELDGFEKYVYDEDRFIKDFDDVVEEGIDEVTAECIADEAYIRAMNGEVLNSRQLHFLGYYFLY